METRKNDVMALGIWAAVIFALGIASVPSPAQERPSAPSTTPRPLPCCQVISVQPVDGVVTAKVNATGQQLEFKVTNATLLRSFKIGQSIHIDFNTHQVSINGIQPVDGVKCCTMVDGGKVPSMVQSVAGQNLGGMEKPEPPCCEITAINQQTGIVTGKANANGQAFQFKVNDAALLRSLKVGQAVYANLETHQVSLDGKNIAGTIVLAGFAAPPPPDSMPPSTSQPSASPQPTSSSLTGSNPPCCGIGSINAQERLVATKVDTSGEVFQFSVPNSIAIQNLRVGQPVWANFKARKVSLDGRIACCDIVSIGVSGAGGTAISGQIPRGGMPESAPVRQGKPGGQQPPQTMGTIQVDPCVVATADQLKSLIAAGIQGYFPYAVQSGGEHIKISDPTVEQVTCPHMNIKVGAHIKYSQTRGFPQFEEGGSLELESPLVGIVQFKGMPGSSGPVTASNFLRATAVLTDVHITSLQLHNVPGWIDLTWIRDCLNGKYSNWGCHDVVGQMSFDVASFVKLYLDQRNTLHGTARVASAPAQQPPVPAKSPPAAPQSALGRFGPGSPTPCCGITEVRVPARLATARDRFIGRTFDFLLPNVGLAQTLNVGHPVWANYKEGMVSLDGRIACCNIVRFGSHDSLRLEAAGTTTVETSRPMSGGSNAPTPSPGLHSLPSAACTTSPAPSEVGKQIITLCLYVKPLPSPGQTVTLQVDENASVPLSLPLSAAVTGITPSKGNILYKFSVFSVPNGRELGSSGEFSSASKWTWQPDWSTALNLLGHSFLLKAFVRVLGEHGNTEKEISAGNFVLADDIRAARGFLDYIGVVMHSPRCTNCHAAGDSPTQDDDQHLHVPPANRGTNCQHCHKDTNGTTAGSAPGAPGWRMAPFVFAGKDSTQLCLQLKDPSRNGGRNLDQVFEHVDTDSLIKWAFAPGPGRNAPPGDWESFVERFEGWLQLGAACPAEVTPPKGGSRAQTQMISKFGCNHGLDQPFATDCVGFGGWFDNHPTSPVSLIGVNLTAPASDAGLNIPLTVSPPEMVLWTIGSLYVQPRETFTYAVLFLQPVSRETPVTVTARDPFSGEQRSITLHIRPPQPAAIELLSIDGQELNSLSGVPASGTPVQVKTYFGTPTPDGGVPVDFSYGGTTNVSGPCGINPGSSCRVNVHTQANWQDKPTPFSSLLGLTISPCASNTPCQVVLTMGGQSATLTVSP